MRDGWEGARLGDVVRLHYGKALREEDRRPGEVPVVGSSGPFAWHDTGNAGTGSRTVVVGRKGTAGSVTLIEGPAWATDTAYWAEPLDRVSLAFMRLLLEDADLPHVSAQTGVPGLNRDRAYEIPVVIPPMSEQRRIVDLIGAVDDAIAMAESHLVDIDTLRHNLLRKLFYAAQGGWVETTLGKVASRVVGRTPARKEPSFWTDDMTYPFLTIADMGNRWVTAGREGVTAEAIERGQARRVPAGSLLLSFKLSIGKICITDRDVYPNEAIAWVRPGPEVSQDFLSLALEQVDWDELGQRAVKGKTMNRASLDSVPLLIPPIEEQQRIVDLIGTFDETVVKSWAPLADLRDLRSTLLTALLSGEHVIPESYDDLLEATA